MIRRAAILGALLVVLAPRMATATIFNVDQASDVCPNTADPCIINQTIEVVDGAVLDFGPRTVQIQGSGVVDIKNGVGKIEKFETKRMNSETVGIGKNNPEYYDIDDVKYAMRITYSGEFIHAAPWSVGSQGSANVSHGCTGMSTENARWLYDMTIRGDVVQYTGTDRPMTFTNGYGDWNESYAEYRSGSALS